MKYNNIEDFINKYSLKNKYNEIKNFDYVPEPLINYFDKPIGLFDPLGENINPLTGKEYKNLYINEPEKLIFNNSGEMIQYDQTYKNLSITWVKLMMYEELMSIMKTIKSKVSMIKAGTGVGKTVITPLAVLQYYNFQKKIMCTVPKQKLAKGAAEFAAKRLDVQLGNEVGYKFKGEDKTNNNTKLTFLTAGSLKAIMTNRDPDLKEYSCVMLDEAHERSVEIDQLIYLLGRLCVKRPDFKLILMSATVDVSVFRMHFETKLGLEFEELIVDSPPTFKRHITYEPKELNKNKLTEYAGEYIYKILTEKPPTMGDIICFVKSKSEGSKILNFLLPKIKSLAPKINPWFVIYERNTPKEESERAKQQFLYKMHPIKSAGFEKVSEHPYTIKVIFATNVAESSETFPGMGFVVDLGMALMTDFYPLVNAVVRFPKQIAQANADQRAGRVGRTQEGWCHRLYTQTEFNNFLKYPVPDLKKTDITMDLLSFFMLPYIKTLEDLRSELNEFISPPETKFIANAIYKLLIINGLSIKQTSNQLGGSPKKIMDLYNLTKLLEMKKMEIKNKKNKKKEIKMVREPSNMSIQDQLLSELDRKNNCTLTPLGKALKKFSSISLSEAYSIIVSYYYGCAKDMCKIVALMNLIQNKMEDIFEKYDSRKDKLKTPEQIKQDMNALYTKQRNFFHKFGDHFTLLNIYIRFKEYMTDNKSTNSNILVSLDQNANDETTKDEEININNKKPHEWAKQNGINYIKMFKKGAKNKWDVVKLEANKLWDALKKAIEPAELKVKYYDEYAKHEVNEGRKPIPLSKLLKEIQIEILDEDKDPESDEDLNTEDLKPEELILIKKNQKGGGRINEINIKKHAELKRFKNKIQLGGYKIKKNYELNLFPFIFDRKNPEMNLLNSLLEGNKYNIAKYNPNTNFYNTCFPIKSAKCSIEQYSSLKNKPEYIIYNELSLQKENSNIYQISICSNIDILKHKIPLKCINLRSPIKSPKKSPKKFPKKFPNKSPIKKSPIKKFPKKSPIKKSPIKFPTKKSPTKKSFKEFK